MTAPSAQQPMPTRATAPVSVLIALWGIVVTAIVTMIMLVVTRNTKVSGDALTSLAVAVIGVAAVHFGHVAAHQRANRWPALDTNWSAMAGFAVIGLALGGGFWAITNATTGSSLSAEAIASLAAAVIGVAGTHIGHVIGHQQGVMASKERPSREAG
jgi:hypothetical protein